MSTAMILYVCSSLELGSHILESPQMWVWPQLVFGGSPPHPPLQLEGPSLKPKPFPPRPLPPSSPPPLLALFAVVRDGAAQPGVGGRGLRVQGGQGGEGPSSTFRCANAQPFLCNEVGPFQVISGNCQVISGNF